MQRISCRDEPSGSSRQHATPNPSALNSHRLLCSDTTRLSWRRPSVLTLHTPPVLAGAHHLPILFTHVSIRFRHHLALLLGHPRGAGRGNLAARSPSGSQAGQSCCKVALEKPCLAARSPSGSQAGQPVTVAPGQCAQPLLGRLGSCALAICAQLVSLAPGGSCRGCVLR